MATPVIIQNPILNPPFAEPTRHFRFDDDGITNDIVEQRRVSSYFVPIAKARKKSGQLDLGTEWTQDRIEENQAVNQIRCRISVWRRGGYKGVTPTTRHLLEYWTNETSSSASINDVRNALAYNRSMPEAIRRNSE
jgi:type III restriction enzyme